MIKALHAGERFIFSDYNTFAVITRGALEVYAVADSRREFLIGGERDDGATFYRPRFYDFKEIAIKITQSSHRIV